jgi:hypothetical protein
MKWRSNKGIEKISLMRSFRICKRHQVFFGKRWAVHVARMTEKRNAYRVLVQKREGWQLGRGGGRWQDEIKISLEEIRWKVMN